ncbi:small subunit ribosomal protein SAe [Pancytospora philotis]|nr:small subunit ribosomal protein SAe [Pancytospora philotis]
MAACANQIPLPNLFGQLYVASKAQLGGIKLTNKMSKYIFGTCSNKINVFDVERTWEKMIHAARAIAAIKDASSIVTISGKTFGRKPVLKFAEAISCRSYTGRFIPGSFTNTKIAKSVEPSLVVISDPVTDKQAVAEAARVNCPVIAFCNADADLSFVDIAIPINNRSPKAIGVAFFMLSRLVNYIKAGADMEANIKEVELFFYRDALELESLFAEQNASKTLLFDEQKEDNDESDFGRDNADENAEDSCGWD